MREEYEIIDLASNLLPLTAVKMKSRGARLVQICAVNTDDGYDLLYSFAEGYRFVTYKVPVKEDEEIVSISDIYTPASLYENEMRELFGVQVRHMKLNYKDKLYTIDAVTPFKKEKKAKPALPAAVQKTAEAAAQAPKTEEAQAAQPKAESAGNETKISEKEDKSNG